MGTLIRITVIVGTIAALVVASVAAMVVYHGVSVHRSPLAVEAFVARRLRHFAVPSGARTRENPVAATPEALAEARAHFADHCAICHANDGSGDTDIGRNLYPNAPDMTDGHTQSLSDGELYYIIRNGVRFTGMPGWGDPTIENDPDSWGLVHFIRHLPALTAEELDEMRALNPKTRHALEEEDRIHRFLLGEDVEPKVRNHRH